MPDTPDQNYYDRIMDNHIRLRSVADALYQALKQKTDPTFTTDVCDTCAVSSYERWRDGN